MKILNKYVGKRVNIGRNNGQTLKNWKLVAFNKLGILVSDPSEDYVPEFVPWNDIYSIEEYME